MPGICVFVDTRHWSDTDVELITNCVPVSEKYLCDGRESLVPVGDGIPHLQQLTLVEHLKQWILKLSVLLPMLSSTCWSASAKVSCWAVLSPAPLVLLSCRNSACSLAWCFWMCFIRLIVLYFAVLPPPLETFTLQTLQTAAKLVGVASVKYLQLSQHATHVLLMNDVGCAAMEGENLKF